MALAFWLRDWVHMAFNRLYSLYSLFTSIYLSTLLFLCLLLLCYTLIRGNLPIEYSPPYKSSKVEIVDDVVT